MLRKKSWERRIKEFQKALHYLTNSYHFCPKPPLKDRILYFIGTFRFLLPIPSRYTRKMGALFFCGLKTILSENNIKIVEKDGIKYVFPCAALDSFLKLFININIQNQYQEFPVIVEKGDIVLDCGANFGVATLLFAKKAGQSGKVIAIEPETQNYLILQKVVELNKDKIATIIPLKIAVFRENTTLDLYIANKPGDHTISPYYLERKDKFSDKKETVKALKIDTIVKDLGLERVDFIKMDIEGAEIDALIGAKQTIKTYKPKLAICSYHRPNDSDQIKKLIHSIVPNYKFKEVCKEEKVLFAWHEE